MGLEFDPDLVPKVKLGLHCAQILLALISWCMGIAVFVGEDAKVTGNNGWTFGVVCHHFQSQMKSSAIVKSAEQSGLQ